MNQLILRMRIQGKGRGCCRALPPSLRLAKTEPWLFLLAGPCDVPPGPAKIGSRDGQALG